MHLDVPPQDRAAVRRIRAFQADCLERALRLGGRPYSYGAHEVDEATLRSIYGEAYDRVRALRARLDPDGLLNRGLV